MMEQILHNKWRLTGMGYIILSIYFLTGYIIPECKNTLQIYQNRQEQEEKIASVSNWENQLNQLNNQQKELEHFFSKIYVSLPDDDQMSAIINQIFNEAGAAHIQLNQMRPAEQTEFESHIQIPVAITLMGTYHEIGRFVNAIEQSDYLMKVDEIEIRAEQETGTPLAGQILIKVIILKKNTVSRETDA
ncbi:MAG: type 4a pilus biogenesis protein PilO [Balneolaceae bacterium]